MQLNLIIFLVFLQQSRDSNVKTCDNQLFLLFFHKIVTQIHFQIKEHCNFYLNLLMKTVKILYLILFAFVFLSTCIQCALIFIPGVPVSDATLYKTQVALNRWQLLLVKTYGTRQQNATKIKDATDLVVGSLKALSSELAKYDNVAVGNGNALYGNKNIIIGNRNAVYGSNNYVFSQDFDYTQVKGGNLLKPISNTLVADQWIGELDKKQLILKQLHNVIYPIQ